MIGTSEHSTYHESSIKPPHPPPPPSRDRGIFISSPFEGGGDLFNLETTMVSVLHKGLEYIVEKL